MLVKKHNHNLKEFYKGIIGFKSDQL